MTGAVLPPLGRPICFVFGKGGTGKSTVAAALGLAASRAGRRALVVELADRAMVPHAFGREPDSDGPTELAPRLYATSIEPEVAAEEHLVERLGVGRLVTRLTGGRGFREFARAAPGVPELVTLERIARLAGVDPSDETADPAWDNVIVDCPATGHALAMLAAPEQVAAAGGEGPLAELAARLAGVIDDPAIAGVVLVALPRELAVGEAGDAADELARRGISPAGVVLNRVAADRFLPAERDPLERVATDGAAPAVAAAASMAIEQIVARAAEVALRAELTRRTGLPALELPDLAGPPDAEGLGLLAERLAATAGAHLPPRRA